jgi:hypothetical protein
VFFGKQFGYLENSMAGDDSIKSVHTALSVLSVVSMAPVRVRSALLVMGIMIPGVLKAIKAVDSLQKTAVRETSIAAERTLDANSRKTDILSQLLSVVQRREDMTIREVHGAIWGAV